MPQEQHSIGSWAEPLWWAPLLSIPCSAALVVFSTGQLERWTRTCADELKDGELQPISGCYDNELLRPVIGFNLWNESVTDRRSTIDSSPSNH